MFKELEEVPHIFGESFGDNVHVEGDGVIHFIFILEFFSMGSEGDISVENFLIFRG